MNRKKKKMDNLHFIPNNILTNFFKELTKYKSDYQQYLNYIYIGIILCILLYIFKCIHAYAWFTSQLGLKINITVKGFKILEGHYASMIKFLKG